MGWLKMWDLEILNDPDLTDNQTRGIWTGLLCAANCCFDEGRFTIDRRTKLPKSVICEHAKISESDFDWALSIGKIAESNGLYFLPKWKHYQNEYQRQKGYRDRLHTEVTPKVTPEEGRRKKEEVIRKNKDIKETKTEEGLKRPLAHTVVLSNTFETAFALAYKAKFKEPYPDGGKKDEMASRRLVECYGASPALELAKFAWGCGDAWLEKISTSIAGLAMKAAEIAAMHSKVKPKTTTPAKKEKYRIHNGKLYTRQGEKFIAADGDELKLSEDGNAV